MTSTPTAGLGLIAQPLTYPQAQPVYQTSLANSVQCTGIGVHSGAPVTIVLHPAPADHGIVFVRLDLPDGSNRVAARWDRVVGATLQTMLGNAPGEGIVSTVEHLMAALFGCRIDNALITVDGPELPIMDGSAAPFVFLLECAGVRDLAVPRRAIEILREVTVAIDGKRASLSPADDCIVEVEIDYQATPIQRQSFRYAVSSDRFKRDLSRARTFGFLHDVERLRAQGLARGSRLDNAVVLDGDRILNEGGLRYPDEFVRHKVLDCLGDLALAGGLVLGHYRGYKSGHGLTNALLRRVFADPANWRAWPVTAELQDAAA